MHKFSKEKLEEIMKCYKKKDFNKLLIMLKDYCSEFPNDISALSLYINMLIRFGNIEIAKDLYESIYNVESETLKTKKSLAVAKIKILLLEERYEECLEYIESLEFSLNCSYDEEYVKTFCKVKLGIEVDKNANLSYTYKQIADYEYQRMLDYVRENHVDSEEAKGSIYSSFNLERALRIAIDMYDELPKVYHGLFATLTVVKADRCGTYEGNNADYLQTLWLDNSKQILFVFPTDNNENNPFLDINNYLIEEKNEKGKTKKLSAIDKFNKRYGIVK